MVLMMKLIRQCGYILITIVVVASTANRVIGEDIVIAKLRYGGGGDWYANPTSLPNLHYEVENRTGISMADIEEDVVVSLSDPNLQSYPIINITGHGRIAFTEEERRALVDYLKGGGFLHADDNYGMDEYFRAEMEAIFGEGCLVELPKSHLIYHCFYDLDGLPKIHEHHGGPPKGYGIFIDGRLCVFYSYNTDLSDGWEAPEVHNDPPQKREMAYQMGTNIVVYALTH
ncbi:MAG: hypothetical protein DRH44_03445 [Candidatus Coatesbacteria bacterium]|nr:MAG: hypothetical protein DRH44_03445 [Candidatus Coatesbacteria bacterium]